MDYVSICSPNYLHEAHIRLGLRAGADVICEKPIVPTPAVLDELIDLESRLAKGSVSSILQLRLHPGIRRMKQKIQSYGQGQRKDVTLTYVTSRGKWYAQSWKGG